MDAFSDNMLHFSIQSILNTHAQSPARLENGQLDVLNMMSCIPPLTNAIWISGLQLLNGTGREEGLRMKITWCSCILPVWVIFFSKEIPNTLYYFNYLASCHFILKKLDCNFLLHRSLFFNSLDHKTACSKGPGERLRYEVYKECWEEKWFTHTG